MLHVSSTHFDVSSFLILVLDSCHTTILNLLVALFYVDWWLAEVIALAVLNKAGHVVGQHLLAEYISKLVLDAVGVVSSTAGFIGNRAIAPFTNIPPNKIWIINWLTIGVSFLTWKFNFSPF